MVIFARFFRQLGLTVAFVLLVGFVVPSGPEAAVAADQDSVLPPISSPNPSVVLPKFPAGDFSETKVEVLQEPAVRWKTRGEPIRTVKSDESKSTFSPETSVLSERGQFENVYTNADGSHTSELSARPLNVRSDAGIWVPVSTKILNLANGGARVVDNPINPTFAGQVDNSSLYSMTDGTYSVSFGVLDAKASVLSRPAVRRSAEGANRANYRNVFEGTDLQFEVGPGQVKETMVLRTVPNVDRWVYTINAPGLSLAKNEWGDIEFRDSDGVLRFTIPAPFMWDSSGLTDVREPELSAIPTVLDATGDSWTLTLLPDQGWLASADRVYPVFVDPTTEVYPNDYRAFKSDGFNTSGVIYVGNSRDGGGNKYWRSALHFTYEAVFGKQITHASIYGHRNSGTANGYVGVVNVATCLAFGCVGEQLDPYIIPTDGWTDGYAISNRLAQWVRDGQSGKYLMIRGDEGGVYSFKELDMALYLDWKDYPTAGTLAAPSPANGGIGGITPTLKISGTAATGYASYYRYKVSENPNPDVNTIYTSAWSATQQQQVPLGAQLAPGHTYYWKGEIKDNYDGYFGTPTTRTSAVFSFTTNAPPPSPAQSSASPSDGQIVTGLTPTFSADPVTDPEGSAVKYQFRVTTGYDGMSGAVISSGWLTTPSWQVPAGTLQDGGSYSWVVLTTDGTNDLESTWVNHFNVNLRIGSAGPSPTDSAGAVSVNLANGNGNLSFASPMVNTVGGPMGLSFNYNSLQAPNQFRGLTGSYYSAIPEGGGAPTYTYTGKAPVMVRTDPAVSFDWGLDSAGPAVPTDQFMVRWSGYLNVPAGGSYQFKVVADDTAPKVTVNGQAATDGSVNSWGSARTLTTTPVPISVDYVNKTGTANVQLWVKGPGGPAAGFPVPSDWFTTRVVTLPSGWSASAPIAGGAGAYVSATVSESSVTLTDVSGGVHIYAKKSAGGYSTPSGEYGVLTLDGAGNVVLTEDSGTVYAFNAEGKIVSITSPADSLKAATPILSYRPGTGQLDRISDPLSKVGSPATYTRQVVFAYAGDTAASVGLSAADSNATGTACPTLSSYNPAPAGMLCRIVYPGHVPGSRDTTQLLYNDNGQLAGVLNPGGELSSFSYNAQGRLAGIRNALANDWLAAYAGGSDPLTKTDLSYDASGRIVGVTLPAPDGATASARPQKTYTYGVGVTYVDVAGLSVPNTAPSNGHAATVTYDSSFRQTSATTAAGLTGTQSWNNKDMKLSATDAWGRMSTTIYDSQDRVTDSYGPAPDSCFDSNRVPKASCALTPAHTHTSYDVGLQGLNAKYYANPAFAGAPKVFDFAVGAISFDWGTTPAKPGLPADGWSAQFTGLITVLGGPVTFSTKADDATAVWIDDVRIIYETAVLAERTSLPGTVNLTAGQHRIRIQYVDVNSSAKLQLLWQIGGGAQVPVPASALSPDYGLANQVTTEDSAPAGEFSDTQVPDLVTALTYTHPWLGAATQATIDPGGLNLATTTGYETPGSGYLRRTSKLMPSAVKASQPVATAGSTFVYWGDAQALGSTICGLPASTPQYGFLKSSTGPTPAVGSAVTTEFVYDTLGRTVGTKRSGDATWSCVTYDSRWRVKTTVFSAFGPTPARTTTAIYAVGGNPLVSSVADPAGTITSATDLLGRSVSWDC